MMMHGGIGRVIKPVGLSNSTGFWLLMSYRTKISGHRKAQKTCVWRQMKMIFKRNLAMIASRASIYEEHNNIIWMVSNRNAVLLKLDLNIGQIIEAYKIPYERELEYGYISIIKNENSLFIFPYNAKNMIVFNVFLKSFSVIEMPLEEKYKNINGKIRSVCKYRNYLYIVGASLPNVYEYDINKGGFRKVYEVDNEDRFTIAESVLKDGILYVPESERNIIHKIDVCNRNVKDLHFENSDTEGVTAITCHDNKIYFATRSGNIYRLNGKEEFNDCGKVSDDYIYRINAYDSNLLFFELFKGNVILLDLGKKQRYVLNCEKDQEEMKFKGSKIEMVVRKDNELIYQKRMTGELYRINLLQNEITKIDVMINEDIKDKLVKFELEGNSTIKEGEHISLLDFLDNI